MYAYVSVYACVLVWLERSWGWGSVTVAMCALHARNASTTFALQPLRRLRRHRGADAADQRYEYMYVRTYIYITKKGACVQSALYALAYCLLKLVKNTYMFVCEL